MVGLGRLGNEWAGRRIVDILGLGKNNPLLETCVHAFHMGGLFVVGKEKETGLR